MIKKSCLDSVLDAADLVQTAERLGIALKRSGSLWTGLSPWTGEKSGSFIISPAKWMWKDFSGGNGGAGRQAAVKLVMAKSNVPWFEAIKWLASEFNVALEFEEDTEENVKNREELSEKKKAAEQILSIAQEYYTENRSKNEFKAWCEERLIGDEDIATWGLGWAPVDSKFLAVIAQQKDVWAVALEIGIVKSKNDGTIRNYDALRSRVTIPVYDDWGRLIGFSGRFVATDPSKDTSKNPKYVNPQESFYYSKGRTLYGLNEAHKAILKTREVYVVEGYADVWAMHRAGIKNTVAHCGKFVTIDQLKVLKRISDVLVFILEDNEALPGLEKCIPDALRVGYQVEVCDLRVFAPKDESKAKCDADDLWKKLMHEPGAVSVNWNADWDDIIDEGLTTIRLQFDEALQDQRVDAVRFLVAGFKNAWQVPAQHGKVTEQLLTLLEAVPDAAVRSAYLEIVCKQLKKWSTEIHMTGETARLQELLEKGSLKEAQYKQLKANMISKAAKMEDKWEDLMKALEKKLADRAKLRKKDKGSSADTKTEDLISWGADEIMPGWVDEKFMKTFGFVQRDSSDWRYPTGIYFPPVSGMTPVYRGVLKATNYIISPLFHIHNETNPRRLVEVYNGQKRHTIELSDKAMTSSAIWEETMVNKGNFVSTIHFGKYHYITLKNYVAENIQDAWEITTLGWQPKEGFFSWTNAVFVPKQADNEKGGIVEYDAMGMVDVHDKKYLSASVSSLNASTREDGSMYENDLYLKYVPGKIGFVQWARLFMEVYDDHGAFGVAFAALSVYKDLVYKINQKMPLLYLYGPKGSGKSAFGESLQNLFFSGKNNEGRLIQAMNMTQGMVTPYSFYNAMARFRNCVRLYNEYDPNTIEKQYRGFFKAAFDGEGRERGSGESGSKKKTEIQKVQGTIALAGQYLDMHDDGALMSRSINLSFSDIKNRNRTDEQKTRYMELVQAEKEGLSTAIVDLLKQRDVMAAKLEQRFYAFKKKLNAAGRKIGGRSPEERLLNNYSLLLSTVDILISDCGLQLEMNMGGFEAMCLNRMMELSNLLTENGVLTKFWKAIESLMQDQLVRTGMHYKIDPLTKVKVREDGGRFIEKELGYRANVMVIQMSKVIGIYEKELRARGQNPVGESTIIQYLKEQPYFIGSVTNYYFSSDIQTSGYAMNYDVLAELCDVQFGAHEPAKPDKHTTQMTMDMVEGDSGNAQPPPDDMPF